MTLDRTRLLMALGLVAAIALYFYMLPEKAPTGIHTEATKAPEVAKESTVPVEIAAPIQVYRPAVKAKLKLPEHIQQDAAKHVVASSKTANDERQHTVTTVIDSTTGDSVTYDRVEPLPWIMPNTKTEIGLFYGLKGRDKVARLQAQQTILQVKAARLGAVSTFDSDGDYFVGVGVWARF